MPDRREFLGAAATAMVLRKLPTPEPEPFRCRYFTMVDPATPGGDRTVLVSPELLRDSAFDVESYIRRRLTEQLR